MTTDSPPSPAIPFRPGLPLDPLLQLMAGQSRLVGSVAWTGGPSDPVAPPNPMRVALFIIPTGGAPQYQVGPAGTACVIPVGWVSDGRPVSIHCRDYPGLVQGEWVGCGLGFTTVDVWEYVLLNQWGN